MALRRSQRVSQSNLRRGSLTNNNVDEPTTDNVAVAQVQSNSANLGSISNTQASVDVREYSLNKAKSLKKKLEDCQDENVKIHPKPGNNLSLEFSSAAYEIAKIHIKNIVTSEKFEKENRVKIELSKDQQGAEVEVRFKVYSKVKNSKKTPGKQHHRYTINCYNTSSAMLVNGAHIGMFESQIFKTVHAYIKQNTQNINDMNMQLGQALGAALAPAPINDSQLQGQKPVQKTTPKTSRKQNLAIQSGNVTTPITQSQTSVDQDSPNQSVDSIIYSCPVCDKVVDYQGCSVCCDTCDQWLHFSCVNLDPKDVDKIESQDYTCHLCLDNALHIATQKSPKSRSPRIKAITYLPNNFDQEETLVKQPLLPTHTADIPGVASHLACTPKVTNAVPPGEKPKSLSNTNLNENSVEAHMTQPNHSDQHLVLNNASGQEVVQKLPQQPVGCPEQQDLVISSQPKAQNLTQSVSQNSTQQNVSKQTANATKTNKRKQENEQKQYIISLENQLKEHGKTIQLLQKNLDALSKSSAHCTNPESQSPADTRPQPGPTSDLEMRIRQIEMQNMQNMCIFTALTSTMLLQQSHYHQHGLPPFHPHPAPGVPPFQPQPAPYPYPSQHFGLATGPMQFVAPQPHMGHSPQPYSHVVGQPPNFIPMVRVPAPPPYHSHTILQNPIHVIPQPPGMPPPQNLYNQFQNQNSNPNQNPLNQHINQQQFAPLFTNVRPDQNPQSQQETQKNQTSGQTNTGLNQKLQTQHTLAEQTESHISEKLDSISQKGTVLIKTPSHETHHKNDKEKQKTRSINDRNAVNGLRATTGVLNPKYGHIPMENSQQANANGSVTGNRAMGSEDPSHETNILRQGRDGSPTEITSSIENQNGKTDLLQNRTTDSFQSNEKSTNLWQPQIPRSFTSL